MTRRLKLSINKSSAFKFSFHYIEVRMINFDDKRNFYRMMLNSEVIVTIIDDEANSQITATCRDLSATGMAIEVEQPLEMSTHVKIKLGSASEQVQSLDMRGKVVRVDEECEGCYLVGISIEELD